MATKRLCIYLNRVCGKLMEKNVFQDYANATGLQMDVEAVSVSCVYVRAAATENG